MSEFTDAKPFPHVVVDDLLPDLWATGIAEELEQVDLATFNRADHASQVNKFWQPDADLLPPETAAAVRTFDGLLFTSGIEEITGIADLQGDLGHEGGGVHIHTTGGSLGVHADFNLHPRTGLHRRLNLLLFLNREWRPEWGGQLELWSAEGCTCAQWGDAVHCLTCGDLRWLPKACEVVIEPTFNRAVILATTDYGFHGVRPVTCPGGVLRISIASYFYTATRPRGEASPVFHWSTWPAMP